MRSRRASVLVFRTISVRPVGLLIDAQTVDHWFISAGTRLKEKSGSMSCLGATKKEAMELC